MSDFRVVLEHRKPSGEWELVGTLADLLPEADVRKIVLALSEIDPVEFDALSSAQQAEAMSALGRGEPPNLTPLPTTVH